MAGTTHRLEARATPACLDEVHELIEQAWRDAPGVAQNERTRFTLITAELVTNVIEHGSVGQPDVPKLEFVIEIRGDAVCGTLCDDGAEPPRGAPGGRRLDRHAPAAGSPERRALTNDEIQSLRESGRGLLLVRSSADDLALTRVGGRNRWRFVVRPHVPH